MGGVAVAGKAFMRTGRERGTLERALIEISAPTIIYKEESSYIGVGAGRLYNSRAPVE